MKIRADEHVSQRIVRAMIALGLPNGWEFSHVRDHHAARTADETWIPYFVNEGGRAIITADRHLLARPHQLAAIIDGGLIALILHHKWATEKRHKQAALICYWWSEIERAIRSSDNGTCWRIPGEFSGHIEQIRVNMEAARASLARRRAE